MSRFFFFLFLFLSSVSLISSLSNYTDNNTISWDSAFCVYQHSEEQDWIARYHRTDKKLNNVNVYESTWNYLYLRKQDGTDCGNNTKMNEFCWCLDGGLFNALPCDYYLPVGNYTNAVKTTPSISYDWFNSDNIAVTIKVDNCPVVNDITVRGLNSSYRVIKNNDSWLYEGDYDEVIDNIYNGNKYYTDIWHFLYLEKKKVTNDDGVTCGYSTSDYCWCFAWNDPTEYDRNCEYYLPVGDGTNAATMLTDDTKIWYKYEKADNDYPVKIVITADANKRFVNIFILISITFYAFQ